MRRLCSFVVVFCVLAVAPAASAQDYTNPAGATDSYSEGNPPTPDRAGAYATYTNLGTVTASGTNNTTWNGIVPVDGALTVTGDFTNSGAGLVTATSHSTAIGTPGVGLWVGGPFTHSGSGAITATGEGSGGGSGYGIFVANGGFTHSGSGAITATGEGTDGGYGYGINVNGGFTHSGSGAITATGEGTDGGYGTGIWVIAGGFTHSGSGLVTLLAHSTGGKRMGCASTAAAWTSAAP